MTTRWRYAYVHENSSTMECNLDYRGLYQIENAYLIYFHRLKALNIFFFDQTIGCMHAEDLVSAPDSHFAELFIILSIPTQLCFIHRQRIIVKGQRAIRT